VKLSPSMVEALEFARREGGSLIRHPGGYWAGEAWKSPMPSMGTNTIIALIDRGLFAVTERMRRGDPCRVELTDFGINELRARKSA